MIRKHQFWYTLRGELDHESKNLIKEATGHKVDNLVELAEIGMSIYSGKVASKKITGKLGEESEKLSGLLKKTRKPVSIVTRTKRLVKKFMPKKRYRKFKVVDVEELAERQCLKPNIQLFAEEKNIGVGNPVAVVGKGHTGRFVPNNLSEQMAMHKVMSNPLDGAIDLSARNKKPVILKDTRWPSSEGWVKMSNNTNNIEIHFVYNKITSEFDDFKFVDR